MSFPTDNPFWTKFEEFMLSNGMGEKGVGWQVFQADWKLLWDAFLAGHRQAMLTPVQGSEDLLDIEKQYRIEQQYRDGSMI